ncbi:Plasmodium exported protein, unknown function [Plasmodium ovale]|uniref:Uncharacterized protein n=2 Tax=Plasmodium ovale TaxID=36330 RepID=A0A1A8WS21_PLAOA|nr:Plasmodium exported protein, unknown function [Plasmodium ovale curtisi]SBT83341.1 Plasmodium exported protein, unknown function [Plasmodium ovale]
MSNSSSSNMNKRNGCIVGNGFTMEKSSQKSRVEFQRRGKINMLKLLIKRSVMAILLVIILHCPHNKPSFGENWNSENTRLGKMISMRNQRLLFNTSASYMTSDYNNNGASGQSSIEQDHQQGNRNPAWWSSFHEGLRYMNERGITLENTMPDTRYPNYYMPSNQFQGTFSDIIQKKIEENIFYYLISFLLGMFILGKVGAEKLLIIGSAIGIVSHFHNVMSQGNNRLL